MTIGFLFWFLIILVFLGWLMNLPAVNSQTPPWLPPLNSMLVFILLVLIGIQVFGWPIRT